MQAPATAILLIRGQFQLDTFSEWIICRARKLSLSGWVQTHNDSLIEIFVSGDQILIDALEVSCSLGPIDARVDTIDKRPTIEPKLFSRQAAQFVRY